MARLQQDNEDLKRSNAALLKKPFGFSSEKRPQDKLAALYHAHILGRNPIVCGRRSKA